VHNMAPVNPSASRPSPTDDSYQVVDRFWIMDPYTYGTKPALNNINFSYISSAGTPSEVGGLNVFPEVDLFAQRWNPAMGWGDWFGVAGTDVPGGNVGTATSGTVGLSNFFRSWTLSNSNSPLPITISSFTDQCDNGSALVQWTSQTELDNAYYTVKKSTDNVHFETVGTVPTKAPGGTADFSLNYSITDNDPFAGTSYYYLYQTDIDGTIRPVGNPIQFNGCETPSTPTVNAYNTTNYIVVQINALEAGNYDITLMNMLGQTIIHENHAVALGSNEIHLNNTISAGIYILNARNGEVNYTKKLVVGVR
jgi:Secretion system C-terminal sorting domain